MHEVLQSGHERVLEAVGQSRLALAAIAGAAPTESWACAKRRRERPDQAPSARWAA